MYAPRATFLRAVPRRMLATAIRVVGGATTVTVDGAGFVNSPRLTCIASVLASGSATRDARREPPTVDARGGAALSITGSGFDDARGYPSHCFVTSARARSATALECVWPGLAGADAAAATAVAGAATGSVAAVMAASALALALGAGGAAAAPFALAQWTAQTPPVRATTTAARTRQSSTS